MQPFPKPLWLEPAEGEVYSAGLLQAPEITTARLRDPMPAANSNSDPPSQIAR